MNPTKRAVDPLTMATVFRLAEHLVSVGYPAHWAIAQIERIAAGQPFRHARAARATAGRAVGKRRARRNLRSSTVAPPTQPFAPVAVLQKAQSYRSTALQLEACILAALFSSRNADSPWASLAAGVPAWFRTGTAADLCVYALDLTSKEAISGLNGTADDRVPGMALCLVERGSPIRGQLQPMGQQHVREQRVARGHFLSALLDGGLGGELHLLTACFATHDTVQTNGATSRRVRDNARARAQAAQAAAAAHDR
jgi:hypothetical protein